MCYLCFDANFSIQCSSIYDKPPSALVFSVEKLVWQPAPFQLPLIGLGSKLIDTPNSSPTLANIYLDNHRWSPHSIPSVIPT